MFRHRIVASVLLASAVCLSAAAGQDATNAESSDPLRRIASFRFDTLRLAIEDLTLTYDDQYADRRDLLAELAALEHTVEKAEAAAHTGSPWPEKRLWALYRELHRFKRRALLSNPAVKDLEILCVKRAWEGRITPGQLKGLGIPSNHECHSNLPSVGYDNEIAIFRATAPAATWKTLFRPSDGGWVGHMDLHWDGNRFVFAMSDATQWNLFEMNIDGSGLRRITRTPLDVNCFDPC